MKNRIKITVLDFDGTACKFNYGRFGSSWDAFAVVCGVYEEMDRLLTIYYPQKEKEDEWGREQLKLWTGKSVGLVEKLKPFPYSDGLREFADSRNGMIAGFLSSGLNIVVDEAAKELNLDFSISTELQQNNGILTGRFGEIVPLWKKHEKFLKLLKKYGFPPSQSCYVGDNDNDIPCMKLAAVSVAFKPKTELTKKSARYEINDFRELISLLKETQT